MTEEKHIEVSIQKLAGTYLKDIIQIFLCTVDSVDIGERTCDCTPIGSDSTTKLPGVLLCAENDDGLVVTPKIGSTVIVALSTRNTAFVLIFSAIDKFQFLDGTFGGLIKIDDLIIQYNANIAAIKAAIVAAFTAQGGAGLAAFIAAESTILNLDKSTLENPLIIHGQNL